MSADGDSREERERRRKQEAARKKKELGRDIGEVPAIVDMARRDRCRTDLRLYFETYHSRDFTLGWSKYHLLLIRSIQDAILGQLQQLVAFPRGSGKALALDTPLPCVGGWTSMGDVQVGDSVFNEVGEPTEVTFATEVQYGRRCYLVMFDDGERIVADAEHRWLIVDRRGEGRIGEVRTTQWMVDEWEVGAFVVPLAVSSMGHRQKRVVWIENVDSVPVRCIEVDSPGHLYLAGRYSTPTHNTSCARRAVQWGVVYGHIRYAMLFGAEASKSKQHIEAIKYDFLSNDLLLEDFPEVVYPMRHSEGIANRANFQQYEGKRTGLKWGGEQICLTELPQNYERNNARAVIGVGTITGSSSRGPLVNNFRPDFAFIDDPQTRGSAASPPQCRQRIDIVRGDIMGMAGPDKAISSVMTATVIYKDDLADQMLERKEFPDWNGIRVPMIIKWPTNMELWEQWNDIRRTSLMDGRVTEFDIDKMIEEEEDRPHLLAPAHNFYENNQTAMDEGCVVYWPDRIEPGDVSAIETAMKLYFRSPGTFASEYQNEPMEDENDSSQMPAKEVLAKKKNRYQRWILPDEATKLTAYIDVQGKLLYYMVMAFENDFTGYVVDYGTWPDQKRRYYTLRDARKTIFQQLPGSGQLACWHHALHSCMDMIEHRQWRSQSNQSIKLGVGMIDAQGDARNSVYKVTSERENGIWLPSHGQGFGAKKSPFGDYKERDQEHCGPNWRIPKKMKTKANRFYFLLETNFWKSFHASHWGIAAGDPGAFTFWNGDHSMCIDHFHGERMELVRTDTREVGEWSLKPSGPDNHLFDCGTGCCVGGSYLGCVEAGINSAIRRGSRRKRQRITSDTIKKLAGR